MPETGPPEWTDKTVIELVVQDLYKLEVVYARAESMIEGVAKVFVNDCQQGGSQPKRALL
jgi:hypothetical protein